MRIEINEKKECCGCSACANICPQNCITMEPDEEGFSYPVIDLSQCVDCGLCAQICPIKNAEKGKGEKPETYACINTDDEERMKSSSGGMFILLAKEILEKKGRVYGAAFDAEAQVQHIGIGKEEELDKLLGSKYLQSDMDFVFKSVKKDLEDGKEVLFSGTPCQCAGLKSYLKKEYENLYLVDFICHGVPSPAVWKKYLESLEKRFGLRRNRESNPSFRSKTEGWIRYSVSIPFGLDTEYLETFGRNLYMRTFLKNISLRPSCYSCSFKPSTNISDITLGDFWGVRKSVPEMFDDKGTSLVLVNSPKGKRMFKEVSKKMRSQRVEYDIAVRNNSAAYSSVKEPPIRKVFFENMEKTDMIDLMKQCTRENPIKRYMRAAWNIIKR